MKKYVLGGFKRNNALLMPFDTEVAAKAKRDILPKRKRMFTFQALFDLAICNYNYIGVCQVD